MTPPSIYVYLIYADAVLSMASPNLPHPAQKSILTVSVFVCGATAPSDLQCGFEGAAARSPCKVESAGERQPRNVTR